MIRPNANEREGLAQPVRAPEPPVIHHLIGSSPYTTRFLRLLEDHPEAFPPEEHRLWIERSADAAFQVEPGGRMRRNTVGPWGFLQAFRALAGPDRVVIHQLSNPRLLLYLLVNPAARRRCALAIWGGDVYYDRYRPRTPLHDLREAIRRVVIPSIPVISSMVPGDFDAVRAVYGSRARYVNAFYPIPMSYDSLESVDAPGANAPVTLLVGNSGDPSNAHAEVLRALSRFRDQRIRIVCPLSYGHAGYVASVIEQGRAMFGERFIALTEFLPPEQYARQIRGMNAAIMNHGYQQALGNIIAMLMLGKKVFVRSDTSPYRYFNDLGVTVHDTLRLPEMTLAEIVEFDAALGRRNAARVREHLSEANAVAGWRNLFDAVRDPAPPR